MTIPLFPNPTQSQGWVCPKCGSVYAPWVYTCQPCRPGTTVQPTYGGTSGTPFPYKPPSTIAGGQIP